MAEALPSDGGEKSRHVLATALGVGAALSILTALTAASGLTFLLTPMRHLRDLPRRPAEDNVPAVVTAGTLAKTQAQMRHEPATIDRRNDPSSTLEPFFHENATRWAVALRDAGADVVMSERVASHGEALWRGEFPLMVAWAFGR